jgi:hypothetical protein
MSNYLINLKGGKSLILVLQVEGSFIISKEDPLEI